MGMFSWFTSDDQERIVVNKTSGIYMAGSDGRVFHQEESYGGYGKFGGKDYFEYMAELNGLGSDRGKAIDLYFDEYKKDTKIPRLFSDKSAMKSYIEGTDFPPPEDDPNQGFEMEEDYDEYDDYDESSEKKRKSLKENYGAFDCSLPGITQSEAEGFATLYNLSWDTADDVWIMTEDGELVASYNPESKVLECILDEKEALEVIEDVRASDEEYQDNIEAKAAEEEYWDNASADPAMAFAENTKKISLKEKVRRLGFASNQNPDIFEETVQLIMRRAALYREDIYKDTKDMAVAEKAEKKMIIDLSEAFQEGTELDPESVDWFVPNSVEDEHKIANSEFHNPFHATDKSEFTNYGSPEYKASAEADKFLKRDSDYELEKFAKKKEAADKALLRYKAGPNKTFEVYQITETSGRILHDFDPVVLSEQEMVEMVSDLGGEGYTLREDKSSIQIKRTKLSEVLRLAK